MKRSSVSLRNSSPNSTSGKNQNNPFSIDYILSSASAAVAANKLNLSQGPESAAHHDANQMDQLNFLNLEQVSDLEVANCSREPQVPGEPSQAADQINKLNQQHLRHQQHQQQQQHQQPQLQPQAHPNFLYFMACMLLQRQKEQQQNLQQQVAAHQRQLHLSNQTTGAAMAANQMDSIAILARLTGALGSDDCRSASGDLGEPTNLGKFARNLTSSSGRQHPYEMNRVQSAQYAPVSPISHPIGSRSSQMNQSVSRFQQMNSSTHLVSHHQLQNQHQHQNHHHHHHQQHQNQNQNQNQNQKHNQNQNQQQQLCNLGPSHVSNLMAGLTGDCSYQVSKSLGQLQDNSRGHRLALNGNSTSSNGDCSRHSQVKNITNLMGDTNNKPQNVTDKLDSLKPAHSYIGLIGMCILSSPEKRMVLNDIYQFILDNYPYYRNRGSGWRNSVRHNLSLNECFQKAGRAANGKGHYWTIHPANMDDFMMGDFRRRRAQRKVRRWNNMDVPSDESDDESVDDANKPQLPEHFKRSIEMHKRLELAYQGSKGTANNPEAESATAAAAFMAAAAAISAASKLTSGANQSPQVALCGSPQQSALDSNLGLSLSLSSTRLSHE